MYYKLDDPVHIQYPILVKINTKQEFLYLVGFTCSLTMNMHIIVFLQILSLHQCASPVQAKGRRNI